MSFTSGANPNIVKTFLDEITFREWNDSPAPNIATPYDEEIAHQMTASNGGVSTEVMGDGGTWEQTLENSSYKEATPLTGDDKFYKVIKWTKSLPISEEMLADGQLNVVAKQVRAFIKKGKRAQYKNVMDLYNGAFTTTLANNGVALISASQANLNGDTVDNTISGALTETTLSSAIVALAEQLDQTGEVSGAMAKTLLVPTALYKKACEITDSKLRSGTGNNDMNVISDKYGIIVKTSPLLSAAAGGSDTAWFLLSEDHPVERHVRLPLETEYVEAKYSGTGMGKYLGKFREVAFATTYEGIVGSTGL
jgi:hypothetical protein